MRPENKFGNLLQKLMQKAELKNSILAEKLQYDVSYISKWSSGRFLPSEKTIHKVTDEIAACITESLPKEKETEFLEEYCASDFNELKDNLSDVLLQAFYKSKDRQEKNKRGISEKIYLSDIPVREFIGEISFADIRKTQKMERIAVVDLFSLDHESRLLLAGIEKGRFAIQDYFPDIHFSMILNAYPVEFQEKSDAVYDSIFLIHMLTSFSGIDFQLYNQSFAYGKYIYIEKDHFLMTGMLTEKKNQCFAAVKSNDSVAVETLFQKMKMMCSQETLVFRKSTIHAMIKEREYVQSILSTEVRFLLGHITELMVPPTLFDSLTAALPLEWKERAGDLKRLHQLSCGVMEKTEIHIMIYESAFTDFIVSGELDFYNHCLYLTPEQRLICLEHILKLIRGRNFDGFKIIAGGFSTDFQYITNPCLFMSSYICYLRLENGHYDHNILVLNDKRIRDLFQQFWKEIWNQRKDVVIEGETLLTSKMEHYIQSLRMLADVE